MGRTGGQSSSDSRSRGSHRLGGQIAESLLPLEHLRQLLGLTSTEATLSYARLVRGSLEGSMEKLEQSFRTSFSPSRSRRNRLRDTPRTMSEESTTPDLVELTRHLYDAANSGDFDALTSFFASDAVWVTDEGIGTFDGVVAIRRFVEDWQGSYEQYEAEVNEVLDFGKGVTFAVSVQKGRVVGSSSDVQIRFAAVYTWAEGLIVRMTSYGEIDKARAAAERLAESRE
jgi:ketosteroid isomerase-like protein